MQTNAELMLTQHQSSLAALQARADAATDEQVKAALQVRIERQEIMIGWLEARLPVIRELPEEWLSGAITLAKADVTYFGQAVATDEGNQAYIANRLARATERLANLEARQAGAGQAR